MFDEILSCGNGISHSFVHFISSYSKGIGDGAGYGDGMEGDGLNINKENVWDSWLGSKEVIGAGWGNGNGGGDQYGNG